MSRTVPHHLLAPFAVVGTILALLLLLPAPADAAPSLSVSQRDGLNPDGQAVTVSGSGFDTAKGIYVAYCVTPPRGQLPTPCGGGIDTAGTGGASVWISDNPPPYGEGLAKPFGPGGSFTVSLRVAPTIGDVDCRVSSCAVVTRADHLRTSDRSQDVVVPVTFAAPPEPEPEEPAQPSAPAEPDDTAGSNGSSDAATDPSSTPSAPADDSTDDDADAGQEDTGPTFPQIDRIDPIEVPERMRPEPPRRDQTDGGGDEVAETTDDADDATVLAASGGPGAGTALAVTAAVLAVVGIAVGWWLWRRRVGHPNRAGGRVAPDGVDGATP